jgi:nicotinamide riboside kinase
MTNIWKGQLALQKQGQNLEGWPFIIQDTDLFSTVGYWDLWNMGTPGGLVNDAVANKSDLYIIPRSNIPFEADPLRYGGDKREASDEYWISICQNFGLNYVVLDESDREERLQKARAITREYFCGEAKLGYDRVAQKRV